MTRLLLAFGIGLTYFGKGKNIRGIVEVEKRTRIAGRLRELEIKAAASTTGDMGPYAIEGPLAALVLVESEVQKGPQESAALRTAKAQRPFYG